MSCGEVGCGADGRIGSARIPGSPEFLKPQKRHLHSGCGCGGKPKEETAKPKHKKGCFIKFSTKRSCR